MPLIVPNFVRAQINGISKEDADIKQNSIIQAINDIFSKRANSMDQRGLYK